MIEHNSDLEGLNLRDVTMYDLLKMDVIKIKKLYPPLSLSEESALAFPIQTFKHFQELHDLYVSGELTTKPTCAFSEQYVSECRNKLCLHNLCFMIERVKKMHYHALETQYGITDTDLISEGYIGMYVASGKYDGSNKFSSYAYSYFTEWPAKSIQEQASAVRLPLNIVRDKTKIYYKSMEIYAKTGMEATEDQLKKLTGLSRDKIRKLETNRENNPIRVSLSKPLDDDFVVGDTIPSKERADIAISRSANIGELMILARKLKSPEQKLIFEALYGFGRFENEQPLIELRYDNDKHIFNEAITEILCGYLEDEQLMDDYHVSEDEVDKMMEYYNSTGKISFLPKVKESCPFDRKRYNKMTELVIQDCILDTDKLAKKIEKAEFRSRMNSLRKYYNDAIVSMKRFLDNQGGELISKPKLKSIEGVPVRRINKEYSEKKEPVKKEKTKPAEVLAPISPADSFYY